MVPMAERFSRTAVECEVCGDLDGKFVHECQRFMNDIPQCDERSEVALRDLLQCFVQQFWIIRISALLPDLPLDFSELAVQPIIQTACDDSRHNNLSFLCVYCIRAEWH